MDPKRFWELAPEYYAAAIFDVLARVQAAVTKGKIQSEYVAPNDSGDRIEYLGKDVLFGCAIELLENAFLINVLSDPFGPDLYSLHENWKTNWEHRSRQEDTVFHKWKVVNDRGWLLTALENVNRVHDELGIQDFIDGREAIDKWEPIPLERPDLALDRVTQTLDATVELLRRDNGYTTAHPEERDYVFSTLTRAAKRLKEDTFISYGWIKAFAFDPLLTLVERHKDAALGVAGQAALSALREYLKQKGVALLTSLFG